MPAHVFAPTGPVSTDATRFVVGSGAGLHPDGGDSCWNGDSVTTDE